jgi:uncharacterized membrane protein YpjA
VPDSPTGPFLMVIVFGLWWFNGKKRNPTLELLAFVELVKYGVWTVLIFWLYRADFFAPDRAELTNQLLVLHMAEAVQAGVLLKGMRLPSVRWVAFAGAWLALGDFCDYGLGSLSTHPRLPGGLDPTLGQQTVPFMTIALTVICYLAAILLARRGTPPRGDQPPEALDDAASTNDPPPP